MVDFHFFDHKNFFAFFPLALSPMQRLFFTSLGLFFWSNLLFAQAVFKPDSIRREVKAGEIKRNLTIDGNLTEEEWKTAQPITNFVQVEPFQGQKVNHDTEVRMLYNRNFLYLAAFAKDSLGRSALRSPDFRRDFDFQSHDFFGISLDPFNDKRNAMVFMTNPYATQRDLLSFDDRLFDTDWDGLWRVRTHRTDSGWVAEIAIPWQTLRYPKGEAGQQAWGINFFRNRRKTNELSGWSPFPRAFSALRMEYAGLLKDIKPPPPRPNIRVQPYLLAVADRFNGSEVGYASPNSLKLGGEVKWAVNPNTVLDLTVNTDFAQADADRQVNNATRFSVFFPERRQFFLENASLFGAGLAPSDNLVGGAMRIRPFFSRRIGLDDLGNPLPIDAGARLVYRSVKTNYGGILMRQREVDNTPGATFAVGRYSRNIGQYNRLGGLFTLKQRDDGRRNVVGAADGFFRLSKSLNLSTMAIASGNRDGSGQGFAGFANFQYNSNNLTAWATASTVSRDFAPEVGFVSRTNVVAITPGFFSIIRKPWLPKWVRGLEPGAFTEFYWNATTGQLQEVQLSLNPVWIALQSGGFLGLFANPTFQRLDETFSPFGIDIAPGTYRYLRYALFARSDPSKKISYFLNAETGGYYDGWLHYLRGSLRLAPAPHFNLNLTYESNWARDLGTARTTEQVSLFGIESRAALHPRLQLIGFYQFNTLQDREIWNLRLAWEFQPLSFVYLVFNQRGFTTTERQQSQQFLGKITYLKQF
jgi:Domain of unknown function (DUF5916)/Carbohydrate family 9 binding domain-like